MLISSPGFVPLVDIISVNIPSSSNAALKYPNWSYFSACAVITISFPDWFSIDSNCTPTGILYMILFSKFGIAFLLEYSSLTFELASSILSTNF